MVLYTVLDLGVWETGVGRRSRISMYYNVAIHYNMEELLPLSHNYRFRCIHSRNSNIQGSVEHMILTKASSSTEELSMLTILYFHSATV